MAEKQYNDSSVWKSFVKIAKDSGLITTDLNPENKDFVGNPNKSPTGPFRDNGGKKEKYDNELYDVTKETAEQLIEKAHPKSIQVADAMGSGGVVENQIEQQQKSMEIATNMPSGSLYGVHAELVKELVKKANELEKQGKVKEAMRIDQAIKKISEIPFFNRQVITKEALLPAFLLGAKGLMLGLSALTGGAIAANMGFFSSRREDLATDLEDLRESLEKASSDSPSARKALTLLIPFISKFKNISFENKKDVVVFSDNLSAFEPVLKQISNLIDRLELELGESRWYEFGMDRPSRIKAKFEDVDKNIVFIKNRLKKISDVGKKALFQRSPGKIGDLQKILVEKNLINKITNTMDSNTIDATSKLEKQIDEDLNKLGVKRKSSFVGKIISNGKLIMDPSKLYRIVSLIEMAKSK